MIRLIAAVDRKLGIAKGGIEPWHIPDDLDYFRSKTMSQGATVFMGQRTFELAMHNQPMTGRRTLVLSKSLPETPGVEVVRDLAAFQQQWQGDLWVVGGASIFSQTLAWADELYLTHIDADFGCDQFFPEFESSGNFTATLAKELHEQNGFTYWYQVWRAAKGE